MTCSTSRTPQTSLMLWTGTFSRTNPGSSGAVKRNCSGGYAEDGERFKTLDNGCFERTSSYMHRCIPFWGSRARRVELMRKFRQQQRRGKVHTSRSTQLPEPNDMSVFIKSMPRLLSGLTTTSISRILDWLTTTPGSRPPSVKSSSHEGFS